LVKRKSDGKYLPAWPAGVWTPDRRKAHRCVDRKDAYERAGSHPDLRVFHITVKGERKQVGWLLEYVDTAMKELAEAVPVMRLCVEKGYGDTPARAAEVATYAAELMRLATRISERRMR
jgi:hypothetical protein